MKSFLAKHFCLLSKTLLFVLLLLFAFSCRKPIERVAAVTTDRVADTTALQAVVESILLDRGEGISGAGIQISKTQDFLGMRDCFFSDTIQVGDTMRCHFEQLEENTAYFARSYVVSDGQYEFGAVLPFRTKAIVTELLPIEDEDITAVTVSLDNVFKNIFFEEIDSFGVCYSYEDLMPGLESEGSICLAGSKFGPDAFQVDFLYLFPDSICTVRSFIMLDEEVYYSEPREFKSKKIGITIDSVTQITDKQAVIYVSLSNINLDFYAIDVDGYGALHSPSNPFPSFSDSVNWGGNHISGPYRFKKNLSKLTQDQTNYARAFLNVVSRTSLTGGPIRTYFSDTVHIITLPTNE